MKRNLLIFTVFAFIGPGIEVFFTSLTRLSLFGTSSPLMMPVYGLGGLLIGLLNEGKHLKSFSYWQQATIGVIIIYALEYMSGLIFNVALGLKIWDYSDLQLNVLGQITFLFAPLWFLAAYSGIIIDDKLRH